MFPYMEVKILLNEKLKFLLNEIVTRHKYGMGRKGRLKGEGRKGEGTNGGGERRRGREGN